jgi:S-formylglutathione hydrolase
MLQVRKARTGIAALALFACALVLAQQPAPEKAAPDPRLIEVRIPAPSLAGNKVGDPTEQPIAIYLPPSYTTQPAKRYPVIYLLHGYLGDYRVWTKGGFQGMELRPVMDDHIRRAVIREVIVVLANADNANFGSFYANSAANGNWEDYIARDLVSYVDSNYRTLARGESRGIAGHSMGGYGALMLGMKYPEVFSSVYALSPCCGGFEGDITAENQAWKRTLALKARSELNKEPKTFEEFWTVALLAFSVAASPNPQKPPFFADYPYRLQGSKLVPNPRVIALWKTQMPMYLVKQHKPNLMKLRGVFIDYGEKEEFSHIRIASKRFSDALASENIPHIFEVYANGDHGNLIRQRFEARVLPFFAERLVF